MLHKPEYGLVLSEGRCSCCRPLLNFLVSLMLQYYYETTYLIMLPSSLTSCLDCILYTMCIEMHMLDATPRSAHWADLVP